MFVATVALQVLQWNIRALTWHHAPVPHPHTGNLLFSCFTADHGLWSYRYCQSNMQRITVLKEDFEILTADTPKPLHQRPVWFPQILHLQRVQLLVNLPHVRMWFSMVACWHFVDMQHFQNSFVELLLILGVSLLIHQQQARYRAQQEETQRHIRNLQMCSSSHSHFHCFHLYIRYQHFCCAAADSPPGSVTVCAGTPGAVRA